MRKKNRLQRERSISSWPQRIKGNLTLPSHEAKKHYINLREYQTESQLLYDIHVGDTS